MSLKQDGLLRRTLRRFGVELKRPAFGLNLVEDLRSLHARQPFETIFDVGANEGQSARAFHALFPAARIFSVEPAQRTFEKLSAGVRDLPAITPIRAALGDSEGTVRFHLTGASVNSSILPYHKPTGIDAVRGEEEVPLRTLANVAAEQKVTHIDLLKIDTQGFDLQVLRGAEPLLAAHRVRCVLTEVLCVQMYEGQAWFHDLSTHLAARGLQFCGLYEINRESDPFIHWADALFVDPAFSRT
jgi:FkbM family methyltransferase